MCNAPQITLLPPPHTSTRLIAATIDMDDSSSLQGQSTGALVQFLPPYNPDIMPIEELLSKIKGVLKLNEDFLSEEMDVEIILLAAFCTITPDDCKNWITHAGYV